LFKNRSIKFRARSGRAETAERRGLGERRHEGEIKPAEMLAEFRGVYKYNMMDKRLIAMNRV
jgi:phosphodiesterase/alkaline phosphatase D-like protein